MKPPFHSIFFTLFYCFFHSITSTTTTTSNLPPELISLLSIKSSLQDPLSTLHDWDPTQVLSTNNNISTSDQDPIWCSWSGVKCSNPQAAQITSLDLSNKNLAGAIPAEIRYLSSLTHLNLSGNSFDGILQPAIFDLIQLRVLDISHNSFNSSFPPGISKLRFLTIFDAYSNDFTGTLPTEVVYLRFLEELNLGGSYFEGEIPSSYGSLFRLKLLKLNGNYNLNGSLPRELGFLTQLERLEIGYNKFSGGIPLEFSKLSELNYMDISNCSLSGPLPQELGDLGKLEYLYLFMNRFTGSIPVSYSKLKALKKLDLSGNQLAGEIPEGLSELKELTWLSLISNALTGTIPEGIGELPELNTLLLWNNSLTGILPQKLGLNGKLLTIDVSSNSLIGPIPPNLCYGNKLFKLILFSNNFDGELPLSLANCTSLSRLRIQNNRINGSIPAGLGLLRNLTFADLSNNRFSGELPSDLGSAQALQYLNISVNFFNVALPNSIWRAPSLQIFSSSFNGLIGKIPDFIGCRSLYKIELQGNSLEGSIPWDIGHCEKLLCLNLSQNSLTGIIPWEISAIPSITDVDFSHNLLTGTIPSNFGQCTTLESFNVSYNQLTGPIPASGTIFSNFHPSSFAGNDGLCGGVLVKPCTVPGGDSLIDSSPPRKSARAILWISAAAFGIGIFILVAGIRCYNANYSRRFKDNGEIGPYKLTAYHKLNFTADDILECLSTTEKIIGVGSTGTVYKAEMPGGEVIAVKKLWGKHKHTTIRRRKGVLAEVEVLGNVRHRNIVRLLGCCSNRESTMLLYEYMPNGNLDELLHGKTKGEILFADWVSKHKIALGVAQGLCYLHHDCDPVIVHRDLKPSNILLDSEMEARVADFGMAKLIQSHESMSVIAGSYGYIAPEYAYTLQVDEKSDIYSYGVVLLEIITAKRSVDPEFGEGNSIVDWIRSKIKTKDGVNAVLDKKACVSVREEMKQMLRIALLCTSKNPAERPSMRDVVLMLEEAKPKRKLPGSSVVFCGGRSRSHGGSCDNVAVVGDEDLDDSIVASKTLVKC